MSHYEKRNRLRRDAPPPLLQPPTQHPASILRAHSLQKAVSPLPHQVARLKRPLRVTQHPRRVPHRWPLRVADVRTPRWSLLPRTTHRRHPPRSIPPTNRIHQVYRAAHPRPGRLTGHRCPGNTRKEPGMAFDVHEIAPDRAFRDRLRQALLRMRRC